ncbi:MAG: hypothetical protein J6K88_04775 [Oscillospiraceae bacterium]|nr:hypothetical protein [Oscillospiraceae bacterium]
MTEELKLHIKKLQNRATLSLIAILSTIISIGFGILFLFVPSFVAIIFFAIAIISILYLIYCSRVAKKEAKEIVYKPVVFSANKNFSFEEIVGVFENLTDKENQLSTSNDVLFFRLNKIFKLRTVLYRTEDFNKKDFDNAKDRINKKANKELNISQWVNRMEAGNMMRFNIIYTNILNDALYQFVSQNATRNLTRVEGIINIAIVSNQILIPPIYGECDLAEISRYKGVIKFINQVLLNR